MHVISYDALQRLVRQYLINQYAKTFVKRMLFCMLVSHIFIQILVVFLYISVL